MVEVYKDTHVDYGTIKLCAAILAIDVQLASSCTTITRRRKFTMSSRAIRRLRQQEEQQQQPSMIADEDDDSSENEEEDSEDSMRLHVFHSSLLADSSSSEEEDESSEVDEEILDVQQQAVVFKGRHTKKEKQAKVPLDKDDDWEQLLNEVIPPLQQQEQQESATTASGLLLKGFQVSHLDLDYVLRHRVLKNSARSSSSSKKKFLFGTPRDYWAPKPPNFVSGGIGMTLNNNSNKDIPMEEDKVSWFSFQYSDAYNTTQRTPYDTQIQPSADANILAMFVAQNPYCVEALYQLAMIFFHTGEMEKGNELLRRALFVHESAFTVAFREVFSSNTNTIRKQQRMDATRSENAPFFLELFAYMRVSSMMGCFDTSLAISQLLLALDPHRDSMGILCCFFDFFALSACKEELVTNLVESNLIRIHSTGSTLQGEVQSCSCNLLDMPNWAFSYALARKRLERRCPPSSQPYEKINHKNTELSTADDYLLCALRRFPSVLCLLLESNKDQLFCANNMDWSSINSQFQKLGVISHNNRAIAHIIRIFILRSRALWYSKDVWAWLYECALRVVNAESAAMNDEKETDHTCTQQSSALDRYLSCDPEDYEDNFKRLPLDANPLDEALVAPALVVNMNHRRNNLIRFNRGNNNEPPQLDEQRRDLQQMILTQFGTEQVIIDPNDPMLSIFVRSILPWARVEGVPRL